MLLSQVACGFFLCELSKKKKKRTKSKLVQSALHILFMYDIAKGCLPSSDLLEWVVLGKKKCGI